MERNFALDDSMVVELDAPYEGHMWTWKAKITQFSIHEFYGDGKVFFQGKYYNTTTSTSSSSMALQHSLAWLFYNHIHNKWPRNDPSCPITITSESIKEFWGASPIVKKIHNLKIG
jgi:hypothetical protein